MNSSNNYDNEKHNEPTRAKGFNNQQDYESEIELRQIIEEEEKMLQEQKFKILFDKAMEHYENEELFEFFNLLKNDNNLKNYIIQTKGEQFGKQIEFEESAINYTMNLLNDNEGYENKSSDEAIKCMSKKVDGVVLLKFEQEIEINLLNFLSLLYEVEYFAKWFPFVKSNKLLFQPGKAKKVMYLTADIPFLSVRDFCSYGFAVNRTKENRTILVCCRSIDNQKDIFNGIYVEPVENIIRADIKMFNFEIEIKSKNKVKVRSVISIDVKIGLIPQSLIDFGTKQFVWDLFKQISSISQKYEGSQYQNKNPSDIDKHFYDYVKKETKKIYEEDARLAKKIFSGKK